MGASAVRLSGVEHRKDGCPPCDRDHRGLGQVRREDPGGAEAGLQCVEEQDRRAHPEVGRAPREPTQDRFRQLQGQDCRGWHGRRLPEEVRPLKIPYPQDTYTSSIDSEASSLKADYAKFVDESKKRIVGIQQEQAKWEAMMPVEEMNLEEALDAGLTQYVVDVNKANEDDMTLWPHDETYGEYKKRLEQMRKENPELDAH